MSVLLPNNRHWAAANWVSYALFGDALAFAEGTQAAFLEDLRFCLDAEVDTLDLRKATASDVASFRTIVERVVEHRRTHAPIDFAQPDMLPVYVQKLEELQALLR